MTNAAAVVLIKALHTAVFLFASGCILYVVYCAVVGRARKWWLRAAMVVPVAIGAAWWVNGHECLLSTVIYRLSDADHAVTDIYLPDWMARNIMPVSTAVLALAGAGVLWRTLTHRWRGG
ncbi:MAG: hypothetical protein P4M07_11380 [Xanthobacteraceae bacterium]|nr:hypothetical protein [Xanthobacteraceae bacterium]